MNAQPIATSPVDRSEILGLMLRDLRTPVDEDLVASPLKERPSDGPGIALPAPSRPTVPLGPALRARRAVRFYADDPIEADDLHAVLSTAVPEPGPLGIIVVARNVRGLPPAVYRYCVGKGKVESLSHLSGDPQELESCVLQREFAAAPATIVITGHLASASKSGAKGYARLMTSGGEAAGRAWTTALRRSIVGSTFAGLLQPSLRQLAGIDGYTEMGVLGLALGLPVPH